MVVKRDVVIIGAGASGLFCALEAARRGRSVTVLDHAGRIGKKLLVSGGGHCNFTNREVRPEHYISQNPHFCKSALARFSQDDFHAFIRNHRIIVCEREAGQLFCEGSAAQIVTALKEGCDRAGVKIELNRSITSIGRSDLFEVCANGTNYTCESLVIATGGLSWPHIGATDFGLRVARQFGLKVVQTRPGLVPLLFPASARNRYAGLSGISLDATVRCRKHEFRGSVLFTHRGLSGPVILQISNYWLGGDEITIDLFPDTDVYEVVQSNRSGRIELQNLLAQFLPKRFVAAWCAEHAPSRPMNSYSDKELKGIAERLHSWSFVPSGTEGYRKAEVTVGGVDTSELSSKTMESKKVPGLYFTGEVIDVTGQLGGYNLQWAWSSGWVAGQSV